MNRALQGVVLVVLGGTAVRLVLTGDHLLLVKGSLGPWLLLSGVLVVLLGLVASSFATDAGAGGLDDPTPGDPLAEPGHGHVADDGHAHGAPRVGLMLLAPVLVLLVVAPPPLGSFAAERGRAREPVELPEAGAPPLPAAGPSGYRPTTLTEYTSRAHWGGEPSYEGEKVALTGFVTPRPGGDWYLTRMSLACCAADGAPVKVVVRGVPAPPRDTWVRLEGRGVGDVDRALVQEDAFGEVRAERLVEVPEPEQPYE